MAIFISRYTQARRIIIMQVFHLQIGNIYFHVNYSYRDYFLFIIILQHMIDVFIS